MRLFSRPPSDKITYTRRPGAYGVIRRGDKLLVTEQTSINVEIQLPGGGIDPGEGPLTALHRECLEETGWRIAVDSRIGTYQRYVYMPEYDMWAHKICHIYLCRPGLRLGPPREAGHKALWMHWQDAVAQFPDSGSRFVTSEIMRRMTA